MFPVSPIVGDPIETEEQARNWLEELTVETEAARQECDFAPMVKDQRRAFIRWMISRGKSLGAVEALKRTGRLSDVAYATLRARVLATQVPTVHEGVLPFGKDQL